MQGLDTPNASAAPLPASFLPTDTIELVFGGIQFAELYQHLFQSLADEQAAYIFAAPAYSAGKLRLLAHHYVALQPEDFAEQSPAFLQLKPQTEQWIAQRVVNSEWSLIEVHSHPFAYEKVRFSQIDTGAALPRFRWFARKAAEKGKSPFYHVMLVFGRDSADALIYHAESDTMIPVDGITILAQPVRRFNMLSARRKKKTGRRTRRQAPPAYTDRFPRQIMAFGEHGQALVSAMRVGIIGVGGIGSHIANELAMLGVRHFILVDHDTVETSNLNRFVGAKAGDAGKDKVQVVARAIKSIDRQATITLFKERFPTIENCAALKHADVIFGCIDNDGARLLLNQFCLQYMIPYLDIGVGLETDGAGNITEAGGQYRVMMPGHFCLECIRAINPVLAQQDLLPDEQRELHRSRGYIPTEEIHAPAVVFLNGILGSMAVGEFLNLLTGYRPPTDILYYFLQDQSTKRIKAARRDDCVACGDQGKRAMGDLEKVMGLPLAAEQLQQTLKNIPSPGS